MNNENDNQQRSFPFDTDTLARIYDEHYESIYRYIYYHIQHIQTAEDLSARVFQRLLEKCGTQQEPQRNLKAWLFRVAYHLIVDDSRRQQHRNHQQLLENTLAYEVDIEAKISTTELINKAYLALGNLTSKQRDIIILRYLMELMPIEIAEILDVSVGSVKALQHRGLEALRQQMDMVEQEEKENE